MSANRDATELTQSERSWPADGKLTFDQLARMSVTELGDLYRAGAVPYSLEVLDGKLRGRVLTMVGPGGRPPLLDLARTVAAASWFPWAGKTLDAASPTEGTGINRIRLPGGIKRTWFPFATTMGHSAIDDEPCILLDYDRDDNPWVVRKIRDELRQVAPKLFLGPAMLITPTKPRLLMYFALQG